MDKETRKNPLVVIDVDAEELGPHMKACNLAQRRFVIAFFHTNNRNMAAKLAGYAGDFEGPDGDAANGMLRFSAHQVWHNPKVQAALKEYVGTSVLGTMWPAAAAGWAEIINDPTHKDRGKMILALADRTGYSATQRHEIVHSSSDDRVDQIRRIIALAKELGKDPRELIGGAGDFIEADFEELKPAERLAIGISSEAGLEDVL